MMWLYKKQKTKVWRLGIKSQNIEKKGEQEYV